VECYAVSSGKYFPAFRHCCDFIFRAKSSRIEDDVTSIFGNIATSLPDGTAQLSRTPGLSSKHIFRETRYACWSGSKLYRTERLVNVVTKRRITGRTISSYNRLLLKNLYPAELGKVYLVVHFCVSRTLNTKDRHDVKNLCKSVCVCVCVCVLKMAWVGTLCSTTGTGRNLGYFLIQISVSLCHEENT
jgi:hypothetical protein